MENLTPIIWPVFAGLAGLALGSFANTMADRLPLGESVVSPGSHCTQCNKKLGPTELIPIISYLFQKGKCRACGFSIPLRVPLMEALAGVLAVYLAVRLAPGLDFAAGLLVCVCLSALAVMDWDHRIVPNVITLPLALTGIAFYWYRTGSLIRPLLGVLICGGLLLAVALVYKKLTGRIGMGGGDPKLAAGLGAWLGPVPGLNAVVASAVTGALFGVALIVFGRAQWKTELPFGTFMSVSGIFFWLWTWT